jgi:hypothetical protein
VASPDTAPVRSFVSPPPSKTAAGSCVSGENNTYTPWIKGKPRFGLAGSIVMSFTPTPASPHDGIMRSSPVTVFMC